MVSEQNVEDKLRGHPFIESKTTYKHPPETWDRICGMCFYRYGQDDALKSGMDCGIVPREGSTPHEMFGFKKGEEFLPEQIDGKEVGNYCPHFLPFTAE